MFSVKSPRGFLSYYVSGKGQQPLHNVAEDVAWRHFMSSRVEDPIQLLRNGVVVAQRPYQ